MTVATTGASEPEPAGHEGAPPDPLVVAQVADERRRRGSDVAADDEVGRRLAVGGMNRARAQQASEKMSTESPNEAGSPAAMGGKPAHDGAEQDGN